MEYFDSKKGPEQVISEYIEREISEYKKISDADLSSKAIAPEAKEAFNRKPYSGMSSLFSKKPVAKK